MMASSVWARRRRVWRNIEVIEPKKRKMALCCSSSSLLVLFSLLGVLLVRGGVVITQPAALLAVTPHEDGSLPGTTAPGSVHGPRPGETGPIRHPGSDLASKPGGFSPLDRHDEDVEHDEQQQPVPRAAGVGEQAPRVPRGILLLRSPAGDATDKHFVDVADMLAVSQAHCARVMEAVVCDEAGNLLPAWTQLYSGGGVNGTGDLAEIISSSSSSSSSSKAPQQQQQQQHLGSYAGPKWVFIDGTTYTRHREDDTSFDHLLYLLQEKCGFTFPGDILPHDIDENFGHIEEQEDPHAPGIDEFNHHEFKDDL
jgi:hypothetical protein